jgi:hypothetical protein
MMVFLLAAFFRLDELASRPRKQPERGRRLCNWDEDGIPICTDPVMTVYTIARRKHSESKRTRSEADSL